LFLLLPVLALPATARLLCYTASPGYGYAAGSAFLAATPAVAARAILVTRNVTGHTCPYRSTNATVLLLRALPAACCCPQRLFFL